MCYSATSSFVAGGGAFGVASYLLHRKHSRLKWSAIALFGITTMQWVEGFLWLEGPKAESCTNQVLTVGFIPLALLSQAWGPLLGSLYERPLSGRRKSFFLLLFLGVLIVLIARVLLHPSYTQVTPQGFLNWWSQKNPPVFSAWAYALWAAVIGAPFLLWWRPLWQSFLVVSWGYLAAIAGFFFSDSAATYWCFLVSFYAVFLLVYAFRLKDA